MTWTLITDEWIENLDNTDLSPDAERFHVRALVVSNKARSNGLLNRRMVQRLSVDFDNVDDVLAELVVKFGWKALPDGNYQVPWDDQDSADTVERRRAISRASSAKYRSKGLDMKEARQTANVGDASRDRSGDYPYTTPLHSPIKGEGKGKSAKNPKGAGALSEPSQKDSAVTEPRSDIEQPVVVERDEVIVPRYFKGDREFSVEVDFEKVKRVRGEWPDGREDVYYGARVYLWRSEPDSTDTEFELLRDTMNRAHKLDQNRRIINNWQGRFDGNDYEEASGEMTWIESYTEDAEVESYTEKQDAAVDLLLTALDQVLAEDGWDKDTVSDRLAATVTT